MTPANPTPETESIEAWTQAPRRWDWQDAAALAIWTAAIAIFFRDALFFGKALFYFDITEINYPYREFFSRELHAGRFSRWCPDLYCGLPLFCESQAGYLHPFKYLFYLALPTWRALNFDTIGSIWLAGLGIYCWLRRHVSASAALGGSALFALGGFTWAHWFHTSMINALASVPFIIWSVELAWERGKLWAIVPGAIALACQVFAGHLQDALLSIGLVAVYAISRASTERSWRAKIQVLGLAGGLVSLGVLVSALQWIPSKELLDRSPRAAGLEWDDLTYGSWSPELIPALLVREAFGTRARDTDWMDGYYPYHEMDVYMGIVGLGLAVVGMAARRDRWVAIWLFIAGLGFVLMLGKFTCLFDYASKLPIAGATREPVRFHTWVSLAVSALAAIGIERISRPGRVSLKGPLILALVLLAASIPILIHNYLPVWTEPKRWVTPAQIARYRWLGWELVLGVSRTVGIALAAWFLARRAVRSEHLNQRKLIAAWLPIVIIVDLFWAHGRDVPTVDPSYWTKAPTSALALKGQEGEVRVFGVAKYHSGEPGYASEGFDFLPVRDTLDWSLPTAWGIKSSNGKTPLIPARMLRYTDNAKPLQGRYDTESVTHFLLPTNDARGLGKPLLAGSAYIYTNRRAQPRARLMGRPVYATDERDSTRKLKALGSAVREHLIVEDPTHPLPSDARAEGSARIIEDLPERVVIEADAKTPCYLMLADTFDPGWSATLDAKPAAIRPAQVAFRAVLLPVGTHTIVFTYEPVGFQTGLIVSLVGIGLCLVCGVFPIRLSGLGAEHSPIGWPDRWPFWFLISLFLLIAVSAVGLDREGRPRIHSRWRQSFHPFTWGSGYDAMRPPKPPME